MSNTLLRFATAGSVDDGKSTLIGRLLYDARGVYEDQVEAVRSASVEGALDLALLTDGLRAEREQGITIDVAYRFFQSAQRSFIIADTPGHEQYTRNMATGASTAQLVLLLVDASQGLLAQTKRHAFIASLLGIRRVVVAVNKMDLVDFSRDVFENVRAAFKAFAVRLHIAALSFVPVSALHGDNVITKSARTPWYSGPSLLEQLEGAYTEGDRNLIDFRFPVQYVIRAEQGRCYAGQIASGVIRQGEEITVLPSRRTTKIARIVTYDGDLDEAHAPMSVSLMLEDELDVGRGDLVVRPNNIPHLVTSLESMLVWMDETPLDFGKAYLLRHGTRVVRARVEVLRYATDVQTLSRTYPETLGLNGIGRVLIRLQQPLYVDYYNQNRSQGAFILIDPGSYQTSGAGMILDRKASAPTAGAAPAHVQPVASAVPAAARAERLGHKPLTVWLTGLSGAGKSTLARALERRLFAAGRLVSRLDGDNVRTGLCRDLGFSPDDRSENIRRVAEVAKLLNDVGGVVLVACISPYTADRDRARATIGAERFFEVHVGASLEICEQRDPKGLYRKARAGEISGLTGLDAPYEAPLSPELRLDTGERDVDDCVEALLRAVETAISL